MKAWFVVVCAWFVNTDACAGGMVFRHLHEDVEDGFTTASRVTWASLNWTPSGDELIICVFWIIVENHVRAQDCVGFKLDSRNTLRALTFAFEHS